MITHAFTISKFGLILKFLTSDKSLPMNLPRLSLTIRDKGNSVNRGFMTEEPFSVRNVVVTLEREVVE